MFHVLCCLACLDGKFQEIKAAKTNKITGLAVSMLSVGTEDL